MAQKTYPDPETQQGCSRRAIAMAVGAIWVILTLIIAIPNIAIMPVLADVANVEGGWVTLTIVSSAIYVLLQAAFSAAVYMVFIVVGGFMLAMTYAFFTSLGAKNRTAKSAGASEVSVDVVDPATD
jgi:hypothetical protein